MVPMIPPTDQILADLIQEGGKKWYSETHSLIHSVSNKEEMQEL